MEPVRFAKGKVSNQKAIKIPALKLFFEIRVGNALVSKKEHRLTGSESV